MKKSTKSITKSIKILSDRKLVLRKEAIAALSTHQLGDVAGGDGSGGACQTGSVTTPGCTSL